MKIEHSVIIDRPLAEVFAFVTDLRNETRWQPEIRSVTLEDPLPLMTGATFREERVTLGRRYDWRFRITRFEAPRVIEIETITGTAPYRGARRFEAVGGATRVTESGELTLPRFARFLEPVLGRLAARPVRVAYARLKRLLEGGAGVARVSGG